MKGQKIYQRLLLKTTLLGKTPSEVKSILGTPDNSADNYIHTSLEYLYKKRTYDGDENVLDNNCIVKMERLLAGDGELASPYHVQDVIFQ